MNSILNKLTEINLEKLVTAKDQTLYNTDFVTKDGFPVPNPDQLSEFMVKHGLIVLTGKRCELIEFGTEIYKDGGWFNYLNDLKKKKKIDDKLIEIKNRKLITEFRLAELKLKTFSWIFAFALIGTGLSVCNFIDNLKPSDNIKKQEARIDKMELELTKLHTLILDKKKLDSLHNSRMEIQTLDTKHQQNK